MKENPNIKPDPPKVEVKKQVKKKQIKMDGVSVTLMRSALTNAANVVLIFIIFLILNKLPDLAKDIQKAKNTNSISESTSVIAARSAELSQEASRIDVVKSLFSDEKKLLNFVREVDSLKRDGVITDFSFLNNAPIIDKTKNPGLLISIEFKGSKEQVDNALKRVLTGGYFIRTVDFDLGVSEDKNVSLKYGGILYVTEDVN